MKKSFLQLHIAVFLAGFTAILGKLIELNEGWLVWFRLLLTLLMLGGWMAWRKEMKRIAWKDFFRIAGVGLIIALHWVTFYGSVKYSNVSVALVCLSASGFFTSILEPLIRRTKIILAEMLLGLLAIMGIYIIFDFHPEYTLGIVFGIVCAIGSSLFPIFNRQLVQRFPPRLLTFYEFGGGLLLLTALLPFYFQQFPAAYFMPTSSDWAWLLVLAFFCTVIGFELQLRSLQKISAFTANLTYNLEPLYGIILAFIFFDERKLLHQQFYIGLALIVLAIVLQMGRVLWKAKRQQ